MKHKEFKGYTTDNGGIDFTTSEQARRFKVFCSEGKKPIKIVEDQPIPNQTRRFFEGAVVMYFALQHEIYSTKDKRYKIMTLEEARRLLKYEFNPIYTMSLSGDVVQEGNSTKNLNKNEFKEFLERVQRHFEENGMTYPVSDQYNQWNDTVGMDKGAVYPQVIELRKKALAKLAYLNKRL